MDGGKHRRRSGARARARAAAERKRHRRSRAIAIAIARRIPIEIVTEEILPRIPFKCLLRNCTLVCKEWLQLLSSPRFTQIHLNYTSNQRSRKLLLTVDDGFVDYEDAPDAIHDPHNEFSPKIPFPPQVSINSIAILGSCDGLICFWSRDINKLFLFNPSTRKYAARCIGKELSKNISRRRISWFGRHPCTGEYTLVVKVGPYKFICLSGYHHTPIEIERGMFIFGGIGTMLHGTLHWAGLCVKENKRHFVVFGYDFLKNEMLKIGIPEHFQFPRGGLPFTLGVVDECLFFISKNKNFVFEFWIMKEYGVKESWTKFAEIKQCDSLSFNTMGVPLEFSPNGDVILEGTSDGFGNTLKKYNFRDMTSNVVKYHLRKKAIPYVNSLISPDQILHNWCDIE